MRRTFFGTKVIGTFHDGHNVILPLVMLVLHVDGLQLDHAMFSYVGTCTFTGNFQQLSTTYC